MAAENDCLPMTPELRQRCEMHEKICAALVYLMSVRPKEHAAALVLAELLHQRLANTVSLAKSDDRR